MLCSTNSFSFRLCFRRWQPRDRNCTNERKRNQNTKPNRITRRLVAQVSNQHRNCSFCSSVCGQYHTHQTTHYFDTKELRSHKRNDHVIATESDTKDDCKKINCSGC